MCNLLKTIMHQNNQTEYINEFKSPKALRAAIRDYISDYNTIRPHEALDYETPDSVYAGAFAA